jgi:hypothetical protein
MPPASGTPSHGWCKPFCAPLYLIHDFPHKTNSPTVRYNLQDSDLALGGAVAGLTLLSFVLFAVAVAKG